MTDDELVARWQQVRREHSDYVSRHRGRVPHDILNEIVALRREGWRRGIDLEAVPPLPRPANVVKRELQTIERSMARMHRPAATRAQATTREAGAGGVIVDD